MAFALEKRVNGVITAATDYGVIATSYIAEQLSLPGLNLETIKIVKNKYKIRKIFFDNSIDNIRCFYEVKSIDELIQISEEISYPVIIKPVDGSGSKGVSKADNTSQLISSFECAYEASLQKSVYIEEYVEGREYGVESIVIDSKVWKGNPFLDKFIPNKDLS